MRILHFIPSVDPATGGPVEGLKQRIAIYQSGGHHVEVASLDTPQFVQGLSFPCPVIALGPGSGTYGYSKHAVLWLRDNIQRFDVVFVNGVWNYNTLAAHRALSGTDIPWAIFTHGMLDPYFKQQFPLKHLKKSVYWHLSLNRVFRDADAVLFTTEEERLLARQSFSRYRVNEVVVPYGTYGPNIDSASARDEFLARFPHLHGHRLAICLSRIHPKKGTDILLQAFAATLAKSPGAPPWHLIVAGPDQVGWQRDLEALAGSLSIRDRITFTGKLDGALKWGAFAASEVFVLPSHQENFGIVVAEALASSVPVVISDKINIWREVERHGAGFIAPDTLEGTIASLNRYTALTPDQRDAMRHRALECFRQEFDFNTTAKKVLESVEQLARSTPRYKPEPQPEPQP
ncbi:MAG TPA: glycosyltransferase [Acidobacteriaceae bacterium]|nr:glycosyltransferase [Acidobacteriaceae bacterium]